MSVSVSVPLPLPASMGEKVILIAQLAPTATEPPQLLVSAKGPERVILRGPRASLPVFVSVSTCGALLVETVCAGKSRLVDERLTAGPSPVPVKLAVSVSGVGRAYVTVNVPVRVLPAVGVNQTLMVQLLPVLRIVSLVQPPGSELKSPVIAKPGTPFPPLLALRRVIVWEGLVVPTGWLPKVRLVGERLAGPAKLVPISCTVWGLLIASSVTVSRP